MNAIDVNFLSVAADAGKTRILDFTSDPISEPYAFVTAIVGGALLSMASHGADQIIVQRLLGCRSLRDEHAVLVVVELGLSVASLTYGGLLGAFVLGLWVRKARQIDAIIPFVVAIVVMTYLFVFQPDLVGFTWYTAIGVAIVVGLGYLLSRRHRTPTRPYEHHVPANSLES